MDLLNGNRLWRFARLLTLLALLGVFTKDIMAQTPLSLTTVVKNTSCEGACDGEVTVYPSGGVAPYSFIWSDGQTTDKATNICYGQHSIVVSDNVGNVAMKTIHVDQDFGLTVASYSTDDNGYCNGNALATASNGVAPFTYNWSNGTTVTTGNMSSIPGICNGNYSVLITDVNGCEGKLSVPVALNVVPLAPPSGGSQAMMAAPASATGDAETAGVFKKPPPPMAVAHSAYPNPFVTKSTIQVAPQQQLFDVSVQVYDMRGMMVANLHQGPMYAGQVYEMNFIPENQPTGVFIYKIISGDQVETGKMFMQ